MLAICLFTPLASMEAAPSQGLLIRSVKPIGPAAQPAELGSIAVAIDYEYDGSLRDIFLSAIAVEGDDWLICSRITESVGVPQARRGTIVVKVNRPRQSAGTFRTSHIVILSSPSGTSPIYRKIVELPIEWPAAEPLRQHDVDPSMAIASALQAGSYPDIDRILSYWLDVRRFDQDGQWNAIRFYRTLRALFESDRNGTLERVNRWREASPQSAAAALAEASYWVIYASRIRGYQQPGKASDPDVLKVVRQYHTTAIKILDRSRPVAGKNPIWYWLQLKMTIDGNAGEQAVNAAFKRATDAFPQYLPLYVTMAAHLAVIDRVPRWEKIKDVAQLLETETRTTHPGSYALLIEAVREATENYVPNLYGGNFPSWPKTRDSWSALIGLYDTPYNLNAFAAHACMANDKGTFQFLIAKIGKNVIPEVWPGNYSYDLCRRRIISAA